MSIQRWTDNLLDRFADSMDQFKTEVKQFTLESHKAIALLTQGIERLETHLTKLMESRLAGTQMESRLITTLERIAQTQERMAQTQERMAQTQERLAHSQEQLVQIILELQTNHRQQQEGLNELRAGQESHDRVLDYLIRQAASPNGEPSS